MTTTYEIYTNDGGTPKAVTGNAPAIVERVEALEEALDKGVVTSVNGNKGDITPEQTGCLPLSGGNVTSNLTVKNKNVVRSVNGTFADANGDVTLTVGGSSAYQIPFGTCTVPSTNSVKVATITNGVPFSLVQGSVVTIKFSHEPTNFTTLNVNSSGAKEVRKHLLFGEMEDSFLNGFLIIAPSNLVFVFVFDGTYWNLVSAYGEGEIYGIS